MASGRVYGLSQVEPGWECLNNENTGIASDGITRGDVR